MRDIDTGESAPTTTFADDLLALAGTHPEGLQDLALAIADFTGGDRKSIANSLALIVPKGARALKAAEDVDPELKRLKANWDSMPIAEADDDLELPPWLRLPSVDKEEKPNLEVKTTVQEQDTKTGALPENEKAFFMGLSLGRLSIERVRVPGNQFTQDHRIMVGTESSNLRRQRVVEATLGDYADEVRHLTHGIKIFLPEEQFSFMLGRDGNLDSRIWDTQMRFPPFMLGFMSITGGGEHTYLSYTDPQLLNRIRRGSKTHLGIDIGNVNRKTDSNSFYIEIHPATYARVLSSLIGTKSVTTLPFLRELARVDQTTAPSGENRDSHLKSLTA